MKAKIFPNSYQRHIQMKEAARKSKEDDEADALNQDKPDFHLVCFDLMAVQNLLMVSAGMAYYKLKLCIHKFTIYNMINHESMNYWFDETASDLSASTYASCVVDYLSERLDTALQPIVIYSDGCTAQNRNSILSNALLHLAVSKKVSITHKYLERGHTQLECDSVHSVIGRKFKHIDIHLPSQLIQLTYSARVKPSLYNSKLVDHTFFEDFTKNMTCFRTLFYFSIRPGRSSGDAVVVDIKALKYLPTGFIQYKLHFEDDFKDLPRRPAVIRPPRNL
ncbi:unnamed protein product [Nesidiocoris tenuis]|uniref:Uncharacterized protein n=1 Tax=Nesidiocoris tenuis TaxID=355587 RepID=A0A6H5GNS7_9HEMI|nr:unnamed protein product [Nesidiocoris tenuis]